VEVDPPHDDVFEMVERFIVFEVDVQAVLDADLHFHGDDLGGSFDFLIGQQNSEIDFLDDTEFSGNNHPDEVSDSTSNALEGLVFFLEVRELEVELLVFSEDARGFQLFRERGKFRAEILVGKYF
jgi:hypothetical protein